MLRSIVMTLTALSLIACAEAAEHGPQAEAPPTPAPSAEPVAPPPAAPAGSSGGLAPLSSSGQRTAPATQPAEDDGPQVQAAGLIFDLPEDWERQQPSSNMRLAQAQIPGPGGPAELTVFFFGAGGGGSVEANLARWVGQVELDAGSEPKRHELTTTSGLQATWVEATGTLKPSTMGMGPTQPVPGTTLYGAVIEGPGGPWFFKATGPTETLEAQQDAFVGMLSGARQ